MVVMDTSVLRKAGLTDSQAKGYLALLQEGPLAPVQLAEIIGESRTNTYMVCEKLTALGLAQKKDSKKAVFSPAPPTTLKKLLLQQQKLLKQANDEINSIIPSLTTQYHLNNDSAGVVTLEGVEGVKTLYDDILRQAHDLSIIASTYDREDKIIEATIDQQIKKQSESGLKSRALFKASKEDILTFYKRGVQVRNLEIDSPAQIIIYGHTVAISTFRQGMITSVINHPDIAQTFQSMFNRLWVESA